MNFSWVPWKARRQLFYIGIFAVVVVAIAVWWSLAIRVPTSCTDGRQNQGEEKVDCGGPCKPCLENVSEPTVVWARFFKFGPGIYEATALVENTNNFAGTDRLVYRVKLFDKRNILIATREGKTFANPGERFLIIEPGIQTVQRIPARVLIEFDPQTNWEYTQRSALNVIVSSRNFTIEPVPSLSVRLRNNDLFPVENFQVHVALFNKSGEVMGVSSTVVEQLGGEEEIDVGLSWPAGSITENPSSTQVFLRTVPDN